MNLKNTKLHLPTLGARLRPPQVVKDLVAAVRQWNEDDGSMLAASVAYYGALSFFPLMLILLALFGFVLKLSNAAQDAQQELLDLLTDNVSPVLADTVAALLQNIQGSAKFGGPVGIVTLLVTAIGIFHNFEVAFDKMWNLPPQQGHGIVASLRMALVERVRAFVMMLGVGALLLCEFIAGFVLSILQAHMVYFQQIPFFWRAAQAGAALVVATFAFTVLYKVLTKVEVRWHEALRGGIFTGVAWELGRQLLSYFVIGKQYNVYGVVGSFIGLMLWIYFACTIIFFGGEYVQVICRRTAKEGVLVRRASRWTSA